MFETPPELIADIEAFERRWEEISLRDWLGEMPDQFSRGMSEKRFGDLPRWRAAIAALPSWRPSISIPCHPASGTVNAEKLMELETALRVHPWRKGPYSLFGIETEWRSDFKWIGSHTPSIPWRAGAYWTSVVGAVITAGG